MSFDQLRKRIRELKEKGLLGSGYTAPELPGMGEPYQPMNQNPVNNSRNEVDNTEKLGYTPVKTTGNNSAGIQTANIYIPKMGAAPNADTAGSNSNTRSNSTTGNKEIVPYQITDSEKELNYMMDMLFMNGAGSSSIPSVQTAYEWVSNPENKGKEIPQDVLDTYYAYMGGVDDKQIARSNQIAVGKDDKIGLVDEIYEAKAANGESTEGSKPDFPYYPEAKNTSPVSASLPDFAKSADSTKQSSSATVPLGKAGQTALGEIIKPNPDVFGTRSGYLYAAYQAGLNGLDFSRELRDDAAAGNFLDEIEMMYKAGETDAKIAGDGITIPDIGTPQYGQIKIPDLGQGETPVIDSAIGKAGNKVFSEVRDSNPTTFFKRNDALTEAYEAGFYGMDLKREMWNNAKADGYEKELEKMYKAGLIDSRTDDGDKVLEERDNISTLMGAFKWTEDANYYKSVLNALGAKDSNNSDALTAYNYFNEPTNEREEIPDKIKNAFCSYLNSVNQKIIDAGVGDLKGLQKGDTITTGSYAGSEVSQGFNDTTTDNYYGHMAYDILIDGGSTKAGIYPIFGGTIAFVDDNPDGGNGRMVVVEHDLGDGVKFYTSYSHMGEGDFTQLKKGDPVTTSTKLGRQGGSGNGNEDEFDPHLHLMVYTIDNPDRPYLKGPYGYAGEVKTINFKDAGCIYGQYWCMTPNHTEDSDIYRKVMFFDPLIVILTEGEIIKLLWKITEKG